MNISWAADNLTLPDPFAAIPDSVRNPTSGSGVKMLLNAVMTGAGMYYLAIGKKEGSFQRMVIGGALIIAALFLM
jgi:hypothetical protein